MHAHGDPGGSFPDLNYLNGPVMHGGPAGPSAFRPPGHDARPPGAGRSLPVRTKVIAVAALVTVGLGGFIGCTAFGGSSSEYQGVSYAGASPFMPPVGNDQAGMAPVAGAGGEQAGDTSGLYAQDPNAPACDVDQLVDNLGADPVKAAAWAGVFEIAPEEIPQFAAGLTPVVLRSDTAVIDHGYRDGTYVSTPAVLATGTAVFINAYGEPTVKCYSGNPLTRGESSEAAGGSSTVITPAPQVIESNTFVNPSTGAPVVVSGKPDTIGKGPNPGRGPGPNGGSGPDGGGKTNPPPVAPLTGTFNYDGTVTLSDGRIMNPDGTFKEITKVIHPAGSKILPDGGVLHPDGKIFNRNGTERKPITLSGGFVIKPDGTVVDIKGKPFPLPPGSRLQHNYDGTVTVVHTGPAGGSMVVIDANGKSGPIVEGTVNPDGSVTTKDGKRVNPNGSERKEIELPDGGKIEPDGANVPVQPKDGKKPQQLVEPVPGQAGGEDKGAAPGPRPDGVGQGDPDGADQADGADQGQAGGDEGKAGGEEGKAGAEGQAGGDEGKAGADGQAGGAGQAGGEAG